MYTSSSVGGRTQIISRFFDRNINRLNNSLGIPSQSKTYIKRILYHHSGNHFVHRRHSRLWGKILASGIYQLQHIEIYCSQDFIYDWRMPAIVDSFNMNNQFMLLQNKLHLLMKSRSTYPAMWMNGLL